MKIEKFAPILIPTLNRNEHFKRCVDTFSRCKYADKSTLIIGLDYPPSEKYEEGYKKIKDYIPTISGFKEVIVLDTDHNLGVTANCNRMYDYVRSLGYESYIFSEDDNEFAPNFLEYVNWGLQEFKDDKRILAICGFKRINSEGLQNNVYMYQRYNAWGFGMWLNRKDKLRKLADIDLFKKILKETSIFSAFTDQAYVLASLVSMIGTRKILGDVLPNLLPKEEQWCIFPTINKVKNYGHDGSGLHGGSSSQYEYYSHLPLDKDLDFTPHIVTELYQPMLEKKYKDTYRQYSRKMRIYGTVVFLTYKLTGRVLHRNKNGRWPLFWLKKVE